MARKKKDEVSVERLLSPDVAEQLAGAIPGFDRRTFLAAFVECFGGVEKFARSCYSEYAQAPPGSMAKQRWGSMVCSLISQESAAAAPRPAESMTTEEIRAALADYLPRLQVGLNAGGASDGPDPAD